VEQFSEMGPAFEYFAVEKPANCDHDEEKAEGYKLPNATGRLGIVMPRPERSEGSAGSAPLAPLGSQRYGLFGGSKRR
jgi:hypothetical protein